MRIACPSCKADNLVRRRYCGKCGCNLDPVCRDCGFDNDRDDRFCGGCGVTMRADARAVQAALAVPHVVTPAAPAAALPPPAAAWPVDELAGLFVKPEVKDDGPQLPESGVAQDDLDRLFGGSS